MKNGMRGGKPRDMATHKKGGKVKKHSEGGAIRDERGKYVRDPLTGTRQYATFSDLMGDLFGSKKSKAAGMDEINMRAVRETEAATKPVRQPYLAPAHMFGQNDISPEAIAKSNRMNGVGREGRTPGPGAAKSELPTAPRRPSAQQQRMDTRRRQDLEMMTRDIAESGAGRRMRLSQPVMSDREREAEYPDLRPRPPQRPREPEVMRNLRRAVHGRNYSEQIDREREPSTPAPASRDRTMYPPRPDIVDSEERARRSMRPAFPIPPSDYILRGFAKGGKVKTAGGGSCRGMGAAQRGGKYTIK